VVVTNLTLCLTRVVVTALTPWSPLKGHVEEGDVLESIDGIKLRTVPFEQVCVCVGACVGVCVCVCVEERDVLESIHGIKLRAVPFHQVCMYV
jgi:hypothetical protein